jgi:hypothetical protein
LNLKEKERVMNDICEMWNLPWHALQRNLAMGIGGDAAGEPGNFRGSAFKAVATVAGNSWLGRARLRVTPLPQVRQ